MSSPDGPQMIVFKHLGDLNENRNDETRTDDTDINLFHTSIILSAHIGNVIMLAYV